MSDQWREHAKFAAMYHFCYGNPGNIEVVCRLWDDERISDYQIQKAERGFRNKLKDSEEELCGEKERDYADTKGWLWVVYKYICKRDLTKTIEYLIDLCDNHAVLKKVEKSADPEKSSQEEEEKDDVSKEENEVSKKRSQEEEEKDGDSDEKKKKRKTK